MSRPNLLHLDTGSDLKSKAESLLQQQSTGSHHKKNPPTQLKCGTCAYWEESDDDLNRYMTRPDSPRGGSCHKYAPTLSSGTDGSRFAQFPETTSQMWCGEYENDGLGDVQ